MNTIKVLRGMDDIRPYPYHAKSLVKQSDFDSVLAKSTVSFTKGSVYHRFCSEIKSSVQMDIAQVRRPKLL